MDNGFRQVAPIYKAVNNCLPIKEIAIFDELDSTNGYLKAYPKENRTPVAIIARRQSAGRGTRGRSFSSNEGGLYMSVLLYPEARGTDAGLLTSYAAVCVMRALRRITPHGRLSIKWVNDIYLDDRKLCGILCESGLCPDGRIDYTVIGIGLNILGAAIPDKLSGIAASLDEIMSDLPTPDELCELILSEIISDISEFDSVTVSREYAEASYLDGKRIEVFGRGRATALMLDPERRLIVKFDTGEEEHLLSADIKLI
jgi:BirA family biotin operon repressor/biotin-[acetyl-CoA-carboxylase] ligase